jgi:hypothetical protein
VARKKKKPADKPSAAYWTLKSIKHFQGQLNMTGEVLDLCVRGIGFITSMPKRQAAIAAEEDYLHEPVEAKEREQAMAHAESLARLAQREISSDFSILHSQALVFLWNGLESLVKDVLRDWLVNRPELLNQEPWTNLKVKVGEYEPLDTEQRAAFLVDQYDQSIGGALKQGSTRFEKLLEAIGLSGRVDENTGKRLFELQQVRNVLVHRMGIADRRLCDSCPWMSLKPGMPVVVRRDTYHDYLAAVTEYAEELIFRTVEAFGGFHIREEVKRAKASRPPNANTANPQGANTGGVQ